MYSEKYYCLAGVLKNVALKRHEKGQLLLNLYSSPVASKIEQINNNLIRKCIVLHFSSYLTLLLFMTCALHSKHSLTAAKNNKHYRRV